jgi:hypothetical protein
VYCFFAIVHLDELAFLNCYLKSSFVQSEQKIGKLSELLQLHRIDVRQVLLCESVYEEGDGLVTEKDDRTKPSRLAASRPRDSLFENC